jgi:hypothetical protein
MRNYKERIKFFTSKLLAGYTSYLIISTFTYNFQLRR